MQLVPEWRRVLLRSWSVYAHAFVVVVGAAGAALSMVNGDSVGHPLLIPAATFACLAIAGVGGIILRILPQKGITDGR